MAYQTLLAHLSNEAVSPAVLGAATILAERHSAHLVGLHIQPPLNLPVSAEIPITLEMTDHWIEQQRLCESAIKQLFDHRFNAQTYVSEWRSIDSGMSSVIGALVEHGNTSDLLILSQSEGEASNRHFKKLAEHAVMSCGRPVLIVPDDDPVERIGERVFVSWDGSRESTRAIFGALPLLRRASLVHLHRINQPHHDRHHIVNITAELANTLARHGVKVEIVHSDAHKNEIADELLAFAKDMDADVLVMGCYGHSPLREFLLGGTTRHVLANATLPVLMSN
ncbi:MAG: nucleotide-binding universal stress UspA family protein [Granulosicoccus sp.]|jgi:nucleotide-binding universal stress UspA family protein